MSYSIIFAANTKEEATGKVRDEFDRIVVSQPVHLADKEAAIVAAQSLIRILDEPTDGREVYVYMSGSLSWREPDPQTFTSASVSINVSIRDKIK